MRWLVCSLVLPLSASAASVLLVPADEKARVLADDLVEPFGDAKLTVKMAGPGSPALNCLKDPNRDACLTAIGEKAKVVAVFVVTGALKGGKGTLTLEMLSMGVVLKKDSTKVNKGRVKAQMRAPIASLLKLLPKSAPSAPVETPKLIVTETRIEPEPVVEPRRDPDPPRVSDAPRKTEPVALTPLQPSDPLALNTTPPRRNKPRVAAWVVTGIAVAAAATAGTFAGLGFAGKGRLDTVNTGPAGAQSGLSYSEAVALRETSNTQLTIALGAGIGAGVSGVVAAILWGAD